MFHASFLPSISGVLEKRLLLFFSIVSNRSLLGFSTWLNMTIRKRCPMVMLHVYFEKLNSNNTVLNGLRNSIAWRQCFC